MGKTTVFDPLPVVLGGVFCLCPQLDSLVLNTVSYFYNNTRLHSRNTHYSIMLAIPLGTFSANLAKWSWPNAFIFRKVSSLKYDAISCINSASKFGLASSLFLASLLFRKKDIAFYSNVAFIFNFHFGKQYISF